MIRAGAIIAGLAGVVAAGAGVVGLQLRPDEVVRVEAPVDTPVVVIPPEVLALDGVVDVVVEGDVRLETRTARPVDAYAWIRGESASVVRGLSTWERLEVLVPSLYQPDDNDFAGDIWRTSRPGWGDSVILPSDVAPGAAVVVAASGGVPLSGVSIELTREVGYAWAWPAISVGAMLAALSLVLFAVSWLDLRPMRARVEERRAQRRKRANPTPPGPRRARRAASGSPDEPRASSADKASPARREGRARGSEERRARREQESASRRMGEP